MSNIDDLDSIVAGFTLLIEEWLKLRRLSFTVALNPGFLYEWRIESGSPPKLAVMFRPPDGTRIEVLWNMNKWQRRDRVLNLLDAALLKQLQM